MIYPHLFDRLAPGKIVRAAVLGTGHYSKALIAQSQYIPRLEVPAVADVNVETARDAYHLTGVKDEDIVLCESREAALRAMEKGKRVIVQDALLLMDLPLDVIVESTGVPEAGALHAWEAIKHGKHVAMVNKEADVTVGPILKHLADRAGVVYTPVEGDQHGLLAEMVSWARELGLPVQCAGKFLNSEIVFEPEAGTLSRYDQTRSLGPAEVEAFRRLPPERAPQAVQARRAILGRHALVNNFDMEEMALAANATGLLPDVEELHNPAVHPSEVLDVFRPAADGGILQSCGVIDTVSYLHQAHEVGLGGGVFIVAEFKSEYARESMKRKGFVPNSRGSLGLLYRPYHLCGTETPMSVLAAGLLGVPTGSGELLPRVDLIARATRDLSAGKPVVGGDRQAVMRPAFRVAAGAPLPFRMIDRNVLRVDIPAGAVITADMIVAPANSILWSLRAQQDERFLPASALRTGPAGDFPLPLG